MKPEKLLGVVAKIERPNARDKVKDELILHNQAYIIWEAGKDKGLIPDNVYIPKISFPKWVSEGIILIEKIQWQSLHTKALIDNAYNSIQYAHPLSQIEKKEVYKLSDGDVKRYIMKKYGLNHVEIFKVIELYSRDYLAPYLFDRKSPNLKTDLSKTLSYLQNQSPGINHIDIHPGNIMVDKNHKIYIIDWWRAKITNFSNS